MYMWRRKARRKKEQDQWTFLLLNVYHTFFSFIRCSNTIRLYVQKHAAVWEMRGSLLSRYIRQKVRQHTYNYVDRLRLRGMWEEQDPEIVMMMKIVRIIGEKISYKQNRLWLYISIIQLKRDEIRKGCCCVIFIMLDETLFFFLILHWNHFMSGRRVAIQSNLQGQLHCSSLSWCSVFHHRHKGTTQYSKARQWSLSSVVFHPLVNFILYINYILSSTIEFLISLAVLWSMCLCNSWGSKLHGSSTALDSEGPASQNECIPTLRANIQWIHLNSIASPASEPNPYHLYDSRTNCFIITFQRLFIRNNHEHRVVEFFLFWDGCRINLIFNGKWERWKIGIQRKIFC